MKKNDKNYRYVNKKHANYQNIIDKIYRDVTLTKNMQIIVTLQKTFKLRNKFYLNLNKIYDLNLKRTLT